MLYKFQTSFKDNKFNIAITVGEQINSKSYTVSYDINDSNPPKDDVITVLTNLLDDIRLTVREREAAELDVAHFLNYIQYVPEYENEVQPEENAPNEMINEESAVELFKEELGEQ